MKQEDTMYETVRASLHQAHEYQLEAELVAELLQFLGASVEQVKLAARHAKAQLDIPQ